MASAERAEEKEVAASYEAEAALPEEVLADLFRSKKAKQLRYFARGHIKKEYAVMAPGILTRQHEMRSPMKSQPLIPTNNSFPNPDNPSRAARGINRLQVAF